MRENPFPTRTAGDRVGSKIRETFVTCEECNRTFKAGKFKDGTTPTACPTCRVGVDPAGQSISIDTEMRF